MKRNILLWSICTLLVILWIYAAGSKLIQYNVFADQLKRQPLPVWSTHILAWTLPLIELVTALLTYFQNTRIIGLVISSVLMVSFTVYVFLALSGKFGEIPCSCSGLISSLHWKGHLAFNIVFTIMSIAGVYLQKHKNDHFIKHNSIAV